MSVSAPAGPPRCGERTQSPVAKTRSAPDIHLVRRTESAELWTAVDRLGGRGRAQLIEVVAEPGMGKTRLLAEVASRATTRGLTVLSRRCTEKGRDALVRALAHLVLDEAPGLPDASPSERRDLAVDAPDHWGWPAETPDRDYAPFVRRLAERVASSARGQNGLVILLDDFQWADNASIELIEQLAQHRVEAPLLVVIAQRPLQASARLRGALAHGFELGTVRRVELPPLTSAQSAALLGLPVDDHRLGEIHEESQGTPLYLLALAGMRSQGDIPEQLATLILDEIGRLGPCESLIVAAAAVLGEDWDMETLAAVAETDLDHTHAALANLTHRDLLRPMERSSSFSFRHPIVRQLVYRRSGQGWHVGAHRRAANFLAGRGASAGRLAVHIERCVARATPGDRQILRRAAEDVLFQDPATATRWLRLAVRITPEDEDLERGGLMLMLARALGLTGRLRESRDLLHEALRLLPEESIGPRVDTVAFCALIECLLGNYTEARALLAGEFSRLGTDDLPREATALLIEHGVIGALDGDVPSCDLVNLTKRLAREHRDLVAEAGALALSGLCDAFNGDIEGACAVLADSAALTNRLADTDLATHPEYLGVLAWAEALTGRFGDARRHFQRGVAIARKYGHVHVLSVLLLGTAMTHVITGRPSEGGRLAAEAREIAERINAVHPQGLSIAVQALSAAWRDEGEEAVRLGEQAEEILHGHDFHWSAFASMALATAARLGGDPQRCLTLLLDVGGLDQRQLPAVLRSSSLETLTGAAAALSGHGAEPAVPAGQVAAWARQAEQIADAVGLPAHRAFALAARGHAARAEGDPRGARHLYERAAQLFCVAGLAHAQALALTAKAACLAADGRAGEVRATLALVEELARRNGIRAIDPLVRGVRLRVSGPPAAPVDERLTLLTAREREIAELAGMGKRTREIAEELSLSPRTIDVHLSRTYRKLGIGSRAALARLMTASARTAQPEGDLWTTGAIAH
ncbi:AAA family ATPase [Actinomadura syzygii]|uniref:AAA family ATPase n=1 Tax=Actinomadura syzygii TaxID=1427538 RepID=A0A5D0TXD8_9ACTN|nr:AAA family ATPase [Actinomadura syzygii]